MTEQIEVTLEELPFFELKKLCKEKGIKIKNTDKKDALISMLKSGNTVHKEREVKRAPILEPKKIEKVVPMLPDEIKGELEAMRARGLRWSIDEEHGTVKFSWGIDVTCNLDSSAMNILSSARDSRGGKMPTEQGRAQAGARVEW